jgi:hypothetical protein
MEADRRMEIEIEELERFKTIKARMAGRACYCGHCDDLRWLLMMLERVGRRELVWTETEAEYRENHKEKTDA